MKRSLFPQSIKKSLLAVPACALMLGAAQAGTTIGLNFQTWYYDSGQNPQTTGFVGNGNYSAYNATGFPVTAKAFGVVPANWYSTDPMYGNANGNGNPINQACTFGGSSTTFAGGLSCYVNSPIGGFQSGSGCELASGLASWPSYAPGVFCPQGADEVLWGIIVGVNTNAFSVSVSGLAAKFPHGYVIQSMSCHGGYSTVSSLPGVQFTDGTTTNNAAYHTWVINNAPNAQWPTATAGLSDPSSVFTADTIHLNSGSDAVTVLASLAGFIVTDQPVVSQDPVGVSIATSNTIVLSATVAAMPNGLAYQWRNNGVPITGATSATYTKTGAQVADSGNYDIVVTNLYGSATSAVATVTVAVPVMVTWDANTGSSGAQDGGGTWDTTTANWWNGTSNVVWSSFNPAVFGAGGTGAYTVTLATNLTSSGGITFNSGTYTITNSGGAGLTLAGSASLTANANAIITVPLTGTNGMTKAGTGTLTLGGGSGITYTGPTTVSNGMLSIVQGTAFNSSPVMVESNATLNFVMAGAPTVSGVPGGAYSVANTKAVSLDGSTGVIAFNGTGYAIFGRAGDVRVNLAAGGMFDIQSSFDVQFGWSAHAFDSNLGGLNVASGGGLHSSQPTMQFDALTGAGNIGNAYNEASVVLTLGVNNTLNNAAYGVSNHTAIFDGSIVDHEAYNGVTTTTVNVVKTGTGTQIFDGGNTYSGYTAVNGGTLLVNSPGSLGVSAVTVANHAILGGNGILGGAVTVNSGGLLAPATNVTDIATLTISGALILQAGSTNLMRIDKQAGPVLTSSLLTGMAGMTYGGTLKVAATGDPLASGDSFTLFSLSSGSYAGAFASYDLPALGAGLTWDKSQLTVNGTITVVAGTGTPTFNPLAGGYQSPRSVTISSDPGSVIYYTTDGSTPNLTSAHGASPVSVALPANTTTFTITALATNAGAPASSVASAIYSTTPVPTWITPNSGNWSGASNWSNNVVANVSGETADFSTLTLTANTTITLDAPSTVGYLVFGDQGDAYNWILADGGAGPLTLDAGPAMPVITVLNTNTTISATLAGTGGLFKAGAGTLTLSADNGYTGGTVVNAGTLLLTGTPTVNSKVGPGPLTVNTNGLLTLGANNMLGIGAIGLTPSLIFVNHGMINGAGNTVSVLDLKMAGGILTNSSAPWYSFGNVTINPTATGSSVYGSQFYVGNYFINNTVFNVSSGGSASDLTLNAALLSIGGELTNMIKTGNGIMTLAAAGNGSSLEFSVSNGTLVVDGTVTAGYGVHVAPAGKLAGLGTVTVPVVCDGTFAPGTNGIGMLTVNNNLTLNSGSTTALAIDRRGGTATYGKVQGVSAATLGGTLTVNSLGGTFQNGDAFTLIGASGYAGNFTATNLPALGAGLAWNWNPANGTLSVVATVNTNPANVTATMTGNQLTLSWPADHLGWKLQYQTNGLGTNWITIPGSATITSTNIPIDSTKPAVFYRMVYP